MIEEKVLNTICESNLIIQGDCIVLGVSGGPDSTCLFHIFLHLQEKLAFTFVVAHINHKIRKEAIDEQLYVENLCKQYAIDCYTKQIDVLSFASKEKIGIEEAGRKVRYEFFEEIADQVGACKIATAHTKNDKVETILMNIMRGSGISRIKRY